jgi:DNA repair photolyase
MPGLNVQPVTARSILTAPSGFMRDYDYTITPYVGCVLGCSYCYVPTLSHFRREASSWGFALKPKENAPDLLLRAAQRGKLTGRRIYLSPNTDPYVPQEREHRITRRLLEVFCDYPPRLLVIQTRSPLVADRDLDLLARLGDRVVVAVSIPTNRDAVRKIFEPRCPPIEARARALRQLHAQGIRTQASIAPLLPCDPVALGDLVDGQCDWVVAQALKLGGSGARTFGLALELLKEHGYEEWLQGGTAAHQALAALRARFAPRYGEGRDGFSLSFLQESAI